ncbi:MAG: SRPBCC family protein, partial [Candidatus Limnocylindria bacterium]
RGCVKERKGTVIRVEAEVLINRPPEEVGRFLADIERQPEWTDMSAARKLTDGPVREGTRAYAELPLGPFKLGWTWEVTEFDPARVLSYRTISRSALSMDGSYRLESQGAGATKVAATVEIRTRGLLRLLEPLMRAEVTRNETAEVLRIKGVLEGPGTGAAEPGLAGREA